MPINWVEIPISAGGNVGKIFVDENAATNWVDGDLVITYTNTARRGGLRFFDPDQSELPPVWAQARILAVGGGGGGGMINERRYGGGGGGGAGGFLEEGGFVFSKEHEYSIAVGVGGAGGAENEQPGENGKNSFVVIKDGDLVMSAEAVGGGGGGAHSPGFAGGSGGGGSYSEALDPSGGDGTAGQGFAGGTSTDSFRGAGGGGAGGAGGNTTSSSPGDGGAGKMSTITGSEAWYAGGGGGAFVASPPGFIGLGGAGGSGVGGNGAGYGSSAVAAQNGMDGRGGGGGGGSSHAGATTPAGRGGDGIVIIRLSSFVVKNVPVPEKGRVFTYDGAKHVGVDAFFAYTFVTNKDDRTTWPAAVDADNYVVTVNLPDDAPYEWSDGGRGVRTIPWTIRPRKVAIPEAQDKGFVFKTTTDTSVTTFRWNAYPSADSAGRCWIILAEDVPRVCYCTISGHKAGDAGDYVFQCVLNNTTASTPHVTNFYWQSSMPLTDKRVGWSIAQAENAFSSVILDNWQEGLTNKTPTATWTWQHVAADYGRTGVVDKVKYQWRPKGGLYNDDPKALDEGFVFPTEAGTYELRAFIGKDSNHEPGNWKAASNDDDLTEFIIWRHPVKTLSDWVDIKPTGYTGTGTAPTDFPVLVRLKEPVRDSTGAIVGGIPGFRYADVRQNGLELRFVSVSNIAASAVAPIDKDNPYARDTLLPFEIDTWNPKGESLVWVRVPQLLRTKAFRMYWRALDGGLPLVEDLAPSETWANGYVGVWHLNGLSKKGSLANSTALGSKLDATGSVSFVQSKAGKAALVTADNLIAPNYEPFLDSTTQTPRFTFTGWYQGKGYASDDDKMDVLFLGKKLGGQTSNPWDYKDGWGWRYYRQTNANDPRPLAYFSGNQTADWKNNLSLVTTPRFLAMATDTTGNKSVYYDGTLQNSYSKNLYTNALPFQIARDKFAADEVRIAKVKRSDVWVKAEYESVSVEKFCTFGLVNQLQPDGRTRAWVNWWSAEPWAAAKTIAGTEDGKYWHQAPVTPCLDPTTVTNSYFGKLGKDYNNSTPIGKVLATYLGMPQGETNVFPVAIGPYSVIFTMDMMQSGVPAYPGQHVLYDGDRVIDIEIVESKPQPIDPTGGGGSDAVNYRVLLANDDANPKDAVTNQSYAVWRHEDGAEPPAVITNVTASGVAFITNNLLPGLAHVLTNSAGATVWRIDKVYLGNLMNADTNASAAAVLPGEHALPWSTTSIPNDRRSAGQMVLQNCGEDPKDVANEVAGATIRSPWYTNGVGTVYFDAVNAFTTNAPAFKLMVDVSTNAFDRYVDSPIYGTNVVWTPLTDLRVLRYNGTKFVDDRTGDTVVLNVTDGNGLNRFYRVIAKIPDEIRRKPLRFRIRRVASLADESGTGYDPDDWRGFIVVDNVIASWPTDVAAIDTPGWYDARKTGVGVLGWETAFATDYPSAASSNLTLRGVYTGNRSVVTSARCHYRWRYLDFLYEPARTRTGSDTWRDNWQVSYLDPADGFRSATPISLGGLAGDLEYWYDLTAVVPFYEYVDYSGLTVAQPTADYTEEPAKGVEGRRSKGLGRLASHGTDWFVRLREGESGVESMALEFRDADGADLGVSEMMLVEDHLWRGFLRTGADRAGKVVQYRLRELTPEEPGSKKPNLATNYYVYADLDDPSVESRIPPASPELQPSSGGWGRVWCDAATGQLMFQYDDRSHSLTVNHADRQDFNSWSDAVGHDDPPFFTGTSIEGARKTGSSAKTMRVTESFDGWSDTPETKDWWRESFAGNGATLENRPQFTTIDTLSTPNGWTAQNAAWVGRFYRPYKYNADDRSYEYSGLAVELVGAQSGSLQLMNASGNPRGLGKVSFEARVSQPVAFDDFSCYYGGSLKRMREYAFAARMTFDNSAAAAANANKNFAGNALVSLVALYSSTGCYEARYEQLSGDYNTTSQTFANGPNRYRQRLCLYRWTENAFGEMTSTLLGAVTNTWVQLPQTVKSTGNHLPFYIAASTAESGVTTVSAGVLWQNNGQPLTTYEIPRTMNCLCVLYNDASEGHPTYGTYGMLSANCEGVLARPEYCEGKATVSGGGTDANKFFSYTNKGVTFDGAFASCLESMNWDGAGGDWEIRDRMRYFYEQDKVFGLKGVVPQARLDLYLAPRGSGNWKLADSRTVRTFGTNLKAGAREEFVLRDVADCDVQLRATSKKSNVVVTDVFFTQWRGDGYGGRDSAEMTQTDTGDFVGDPDSYGYQSKIVFTSGVIVTNETAGFAHKVRLSAKRTPVGKPSSVRSPFFDGLQNRDYTWRGKGLGMMSVTYENAQTNVNLLVQIATNVQAGASIWDLTRSVDERIGWTTVTNFDFSAETMTDEVRRRGVLTVHLGLHGQVGLMRFVLDPALVGHVQTNGVADAEAFGEIDITKVVCRDEPDLEAADWWGWNVRTAESVANGVGDNLRTYLPDGDLDAEGAGMPIALNSSITENVRPEDTEDIKSHMPFVQTPTFTNNIVGEVSFRARRYDNGDASQYAEVELYGASSGLEGQDANWTPLKRFVVSNVTWQAYSFRAAGSYSAFRLGVVGVDGVEYHHHERREYDPAVRILLDEVMVFEAVNPTMGFRYVYPFRDGIGETTACTNVVDGAYRPLRDAQPLCSESWTVQAEIMPNQLPDEIDMTDKPPRVVFHWYEGIDPWGYAKWGGRAGARTAELALADGESMVFRGSLLTARDAIVPASTRSPSVVQYSADVIFHTKAGLELTNSLVRNAATTWVKPAWYEPVDYNAQYGKGRTVSAYTILETIAPGRAWINEVNLWDGRGAVDGSYPGDFDQYVEIAAPELQPLEGWRLDYIANDYKTNVLCRFSSGVTGDGYVPPAKDLATVPAARMNAYRTNDYVFLSVQSPKSRDAGAWAGEPAAVDGTWNNFDNRGGALNATRPIALRLVRPSQIVEQEIVLEGTNNASGRYEWRDSATNWLAKLERTMPRGTSKFYIAGNEYANRPDQSDGVVRGTGATSNDWTNLMVKTPGRVNEGQIVPFGYVLYPNGELMIVRAQVGAGGHILQALPGEPLTPAELTLMIRKGGAGTNITYQVAPWWEIASVTTNGTEWSGLAGRTGTFELRGVGAGMSNDVTVVATAQPLSELAEKYGLTPANPYTTAVMNWLEGGRNYWDVPFENPGEIHLAELRTAFTYSYVTNLDLTTMYWLDMDPTASNLVLRAGVVGFEPLQRTERERNYTHLRLKLHMEITNETSHAAYAPYVLRGLEPGSTTADYSGAWTSATFKVTGALIKDMKAMSEWVPLRWFVFKPDGSKANKSASFGDDFRSTLDIWDPKDWNRAIWTKDWCNYPEAGIWFRWAIDDRGVPQNIEPLKPDSTFIE